MVRTKSQVLNIYFYCSTYNLSQKHSENDFLDAIHPIINLLPNFGSTNPQRKRKVGCKVEIRLSWQQGNSPDKCKVNCIYSLEVIEIMGQVKLQWRQTDMWPQENKTRPERLGQLRLSPLVRRELLMLSLETTNFHSVWLLGPLMPQQTEPIR